MSSEDTFILGNSDSPSLELEGLNDTIPSPLPIYNHPVDDSGNIILPSISESDVEIEELPHQHSAGISNCVQQIAQTLNPQRVTLITVIALNESMSIDKFDDPTPDQGKINENKNSEVPFPKMDKGITSEYTVNKTCREVERTRGVSTTDIVGRMLLLTREHFKRGDREYEVGRRQSSSLGLDHTATVPFTACSQFLPTSRKIIQFSEGIEPRKNDVVVYVAGAFDLFHTGHLDFLKKAKEQGDFLIVGLHTDPTVNSYKGSNYPIMNLHERVLSVLACRYVNEVVIGAPYAVTDELLSHFNISLVFHGSRTRISEDTDGSDPYDLPKKKGMFKLLDSGNSTTTEKIVERIIKHRLQYLERNSRKKLINLDNHII